VVQELSVPQHARLLLDFANTVDVEAATDELSSTSHLSTWLRQNGLLTTQARASSEDLAMALQLRATLRTAMQQHHDSEQQHDSQDGPDAPSVQGVQAIPGLDLRVQLSGNDVELIPTATGVRGALGKIAAAVVHAAAEGSWGRLKICPAQDCQWAFLDASKNRSRTWCSMRVCGNRTKTRAYRSRRRTEA
jgi:predicted RNA-binding Zn ribbon-like protein